MAEKKQREPTIFARDLLKQLGPGLITGASDDDPSGIGTYSQAGAQLGFSIGWTMLVTGLSWSMVSGAPAATVGPTAHEITLGEEEISDVSLATFYVFDKENVGGSEPGVQLVGHGGGGCRHGGGGCHHGGCGGCHHGGCGGCHHGGCGGCGGCVGIWWGGCGGCGGCSGGYWCWQNGVRIWCYY